MYCMPLTLRDNVYTTVHNQTRVILYLILSAFDYSPIMVCGQRYSHHYICHVKESLSVVSTQIWRHGRQWLGLRSLYADMMV